MLLIGEVSVTSASQILESLWNIWSHVTQGREELFKNGSLLSLFYEDAIPAHSSGMYTVYTIYYDGNMR